MRSDVDTLIPNQCGCGKPGRYIVRHDGVTTSSCSKGPRCLTREQLQAENTMLRKGLEDIIQHQEIIGGSLARISAVVFIARKALMESKDSHEAG